MKNIQISLWSCIQLSITKIVEIRYVNFGRNHRRHDQISLVSSCIQTFCLFLYCKTQSYLSTNFKFVSSVQGKVFIFDIDD